jgi:hypothetical protein
MTLPIDLQQRDDGVILPVRAKPGARRNSIEAIHDNQLRVAVTAAAEKGKANRAIIALLAKTLGLPKSSFEIIAGATSSQKRVLIRGIEPARIRESIERLLERE